LRGYKPIYRKLKGWHLYKDSRHVHLWVHLLLTATHKEVKTSWGGKTITLKPGQLIAGRYQLSKETDIEASFIKRALKRYKSDLQIDLLPSPTSTLITILNWPYYDNADLQLDQRVTYQRPTSDQRVTTKQEVKNVKNVKKDKDKEKKTYKKKERVTVYSDVFEQFWEVYPKKVGKKKAFDSWENLNSDLPPIQAVVQSVKAHKQSTWWANSRYIPHPATWLNGHGWLNEVDDQEEIPF